MAEFEKPTELMAAVPSAGEAGYTKMDAYTPFPVEGLAEALGLRRTRVPLAVFLGGLIGCVGGFSMQYWCMAVSYPMNIGGRPLNSWPMFIPVTFELTVLFSALTAVIGMLFLNRPPVPYHPVFHVSDLALATRDPVFPCLRAREP